MVGRLDGEQGGLVRRGRHRDRRLAGGRRPGAEIDASRDRGHRHGSAGDNQHIPHTVFLSTTSWELRLWGVKRLPPHLAQNRSDAGHAAGIRIILVVDEDAGRRPHPQRLARLDVTDDLVQRAIVGTSAEDIKKLRTQKPEIRSAQREAAMREVKERAKEKKAAKQKAKASQPKQSKQMKQPKGGNKNARGGKRL